MTLSISIRPSRKKTEDEALNLAYGIHIFSSLKISNKNILKNILEI